MADHYRIRNNSRVLLKQAQDLLNSIGNDIREQKLTTVSDVMRRMLEGLRQFFTELGAPTMKKRYAPIDGPPWSDDYNQTMTEIHNDLTTAFQETDLLADSIVSHYNYSEIQREYLLNRLKRARERLDDFVLFSNVVNEGIIHAKDTFSNLDKIDLGAETLPLASINPNEGVVTLKRVDSINRSEGAVVSIVASDSNGFPGNTHQIKVSTETDFDGSRHKLVFYGEEDPHLDPKVMLDENPDTWFEYETCNVPDSIKAKYKYYGFQYADGEWWTRDPADKYKMDPPKGRETPNLSKPLRLSLEIRLPQPTIINWININPYIPPFDGAQPPRIVDVLVSDGEGYKRSITGEMDRNLILSEELNEFPATYDPDMIPCGNDYTGQAVYTFPPTLAKTISIIIEQDRPYSCDIGHIIWKRIDTIRETKTGPLFGLLGGNETRVKKKETLVEGPKAPLSALYSDWNDALGIDNALEGTGFLGELVGNILGGISGALFGSTTKELIGSEIVSERIRLNGWRWALGIRDINIYSYAFAEKSEVVSKEHIIGEPIKRVTLTVNEEIPKVFLDKGGWQNRNEWIKYYISVDGTTWHRISPQGHSETLDPTTGELVPEIYIINSELGPADRNPRAGYIDTKGEPVSIRFKAVLSRPTNMEDARAFTPVLRGYALKVQTGGDGE
jgi:hypothetical protein